MPDNMRADKDKPTIPCRGCGKPSSRVQAKSQQFCTKCRYDTKLVRRDKLSKRKNEEPLPAVEESCAGAELHAELSSPASIGQRLLA